MHVAQVQYLHVLSLWHMYVLWRLYMHVMYLSVVHFSKVLYMHAADPKCRQRLYLLHMHSLSLQYALTVASYLPYVSVLLL